MIQLTRFAMCDNRTVGRMSYAGKHYWTIEKPWIDNTPFVSCIPEGYYKLARVDSPKFGEDMWEVSNVPGRSHILIHVANTAADVVGCIGLGLGLWSQCEGVGPSRTAIEEFYALTAGLTEEEIIIRTGAFNE